jgi:hypothetical protein
MSNESRRFVQVIDLYSRHPAELERALNHWRASSMAREHIVDVEVDRDAADAEHLVLQVEYEPVVSSAALPAQTSPDAEQVVALLDRPPRFRAAES